MSYHEMLEFTVNMSSEKINNYFSGKWYEQARYEMFWQEGCENSVAEYTVNEDGKISIVNSCVQFGIPQHVEGKAQKIEENSSKAAFKVSFAPAIWGGYYIVFLQHENDYSKGISFVAGNYFKYFWILTRKPRLSNSEKKNICIALSELRLKGYPIQQVKLIWNDTKNPCL